MNHGGDKTARPISGGEIGRRVLYCLVPSELAPKLHDVLRAHFAGDPAIEVVVEQRDSERRGGMERRKATTAAPAPKDERRRIKEPDGRRVAERRTKPLVATKIPPLPRRARRYADQLRFFARLEPSGMHAEDVETARLVTRVQGGDRNAFAAIYSRYFDRVYGYLRVVLRDAHDAEDAAQQVFMQVFEAMPRYTHRRQPFRAWLFVIARNYAITALKKSQRVDLVEPAEISDRAGANGENGGEDEAYLRSLDWISDRDLVLFVERLPLVQRQVLLLRYVLDLPHAEIAKILDRTPEDVRTTQRRAMAFLRQRLAAVGRVPVGPGSRTRMLGRTRQAYVLRKRRYALHV